MDPRELRHARIIGYAGLLLTLAACDSSEALSGRQGKKGAAAVASSAGLADAGAAGAPTIAMSVSGCFNLKDPNHLCVSQVMDHDQLDVPLNVPLDVWIQCAGSAVAGKMTNTENWVIDTVHDHWLIPGDQPVGKNIHFFGKCFATDGQVASQDFDVVWTAVPGAQASAPAPGTPGGAADGTRSMLEICNAEYVSSYADRPTYDACIDQLVAARSTCIRTPPLGIDARCNCETAFFLQDQSLCFANGGSDSTCGLITHNLTSVPVLDHFSSSNLGRGGPGWQPSSYNYDRLFRLCNR